MSSPPADGRSARPVDGLPSSPRSSLSAAPSRRGDGTLGVVAAGLRFQNPLVLAAGTAAYGRELTDAVDLERLGGLVTKAVSVEPRGGAPSAWRTPEWTRCVAPNYPGWPRTGRRRVCW